LTDAPGASTQAAGLQLSRLGFGGAPLGNLFAPIEDYDANNLVGHALASGATYVDTAPHYGNGLSEHRVGAALRFSCRSR
jgi:D-threo-aldose 1-dehydrogenase